MRVTFGSIKGERGDNKDVRKLKPESTGANKSVLYNVNKITVSIDAMNENKVVAKQPQVLNKSQTEASQLTSPTRKRELDSEKKMKGRQTQ